MNINPLPITPGITQIIKDDLDDPSNSGFSETPKDCQDSPNLTRNPVVNDILRNVFTSDYPLQMDILSFFEEQLEQVKAEKADGPHCKKKKMTHNIIREGNIVAIDSEATSDPTEGLHLSTPIHHLPPTHTNPGSYEGAKTNLRHVGVVKNIREGISFFLLVSIRHWMVSSTLSMLTYSYLICWILLLVSGSKRAMSSRVSVCLSVC